MVNKQKKKRSKKYQGRDAKLQAPKVLRVSAEERSPLKEWWLRYGQLAKVVGGIVGVIIAVIILLIGIVGML